MIKVFEDKKSVDLYSELLSKGFSNETISKYGLNFMDLTIENNEYPAHKILNMTVLMRSNDLIFGFCNDQYCFSQLQKYVASRIGATVGDYYHFAQDLHIYLPSTNVYPKHINDYLKNVLKL